MIAPWTDPEDRLLARDILGTDDVVAACAAIEAWAERHGLGPATVTDIALSIGAGVTLGRTDGGRLFVKIWPGRVDARALGAQVEVQRRLVAIGFPAPAPLLGPAPLGPPLALAMTYACPGTAAATITPPLRRAMAETLARLVEQALPLATLDGLPTRSLPAGAIWPRPHSALFDFVATAAGAEWIDALAFDALVTLRADPTRMVVGHVDWSTRNLRFDGDAVAMVYDWDSVFLEREAIVVGSAAAQFLVSADLDVPTPPSPADAAAFVADYEVARGGMFTPAARDAIAAAATYAWAYTARCEHALDPDGKRWAGSSRSGLRAHGPCRFSS